MNSTALSPNVNHRGSRAKATLIVMASIAAFLLVHAYLDGRPIDVPVSSDVGIQCASYTPSHNARIGYNLKVPAEIIRQDLAILSKDMKCIRTYTVNEGLDQVPSIAREFGMKVMLGLWISANPEDNAREVAHGIEVARANRDVVSSIIVGNEVLLRRELTSAQLHSLLKQVHDAVDVPVTYADVWEFWLRNPELTQTASFITIHILPYWEDNPIAIDHALDHVKNIYAKVQVAYPGKHILIGETGWPSAGRTRFQSEPSLVNEARFIREFVAYAARENIPYNIIEAFDQPWKRAQEGTVGGTWGLYDANGERKFAFTGAVTPQPLWYVGPIAGAVLAVLALMLLRRRSPQPTLATQVFISLAALSAGCVLAMQWRYLSVSNRNITEWIATIAWSAGGWLAYIMCCYAIANWLRRKQDSESLVAIPGINQTLHAVGHGAKQTAFYGARFLGLLRFLVLAGAAYVCLGLVFEGRGRDFPISILALPVAAFALHAILGKAAQRAAANEEWLLSFILIASSGFVIWNETWLNQRAVAWCLLCALFATSVLLNLQNKQSKSV